jgi:putative oxidoreductase
MKIAVLIACILVGLTFFVFGLNGFLGLIPRPPLPPGLAGQFQVVLFQSHYVWFVSGFQLVGGMLLLVNRYVVLALTILGAVIVNILLYHLLLDRTGGIVAVVVTLLWGLLVFRYRQHFSGLFVQRAS